MVVGFGLPDWAGGTVTRDFAMSNILRIVAVRSDMCCNRRERQLCGHLLNARFGLHEDRGWEYFYK